MATFSEVVDPQSCLIAPAGSQENFADSLRWSAGPLLGGMDWLIEKIINFSFIAELVEPLSGDWNGLERGAQAWRCAADASSAVAQNYDAAAQGVATAWTGDAAEAAIERLISVAEGFGDYADGCSAMAEVTDSLIDLCKATAEAIAEILAQVGDYLSRLAMEASVPVIGWATGVIDGAVSGALLLGKLEKGYELLKKSS